MSARTVLAPACVGTRGRVKKGHTSIDVSPNDTSPYDIDAKDLFSRERFKSAATLAYYTIFHTARALLYKKRYREKSHIQLAFAIKAFYVDEGLLPQEYYDNFIQALDFRELADYKSKFSKEGAEEYSSRGRSY